MHCRHSRGEPHPATRYHKDSVEFFGGQPDHCLLLSALLPLYHGLHTLAPPLLMRACTANIVKFGGKCQLSEGITR